MIRPDKRPGTLFGGRFPYSHRRVRKKPASTTTSAASTPRTASNVKGIGIARLLLETRPSCSPRTFMPVRHRINDLVGVLAHAPSQCTSSPMRVSTIVRSRRFQAVGVPTSLRQRPSTNTSLTSRLEKSTRSKVSECPSVAAEG